MIVQQNADATVKPANRREPASTRRSTQTAPLDPDQILNAAARLFLERGYDGTRMQDIAATFGVTHAALYYYFPRKADLLASLNLAALDTLLSGASAAVERASSPGECFRLQLEAHVRFVLDNLPLVGCFFHYDESIPHEEVRVIHELRRKYTGMLVVSFAEAQADGSFTSDVGSTVAVNVLIGAANWMCQWFSMNDDTDIDVLTRQLIQMLSEGFVRRPR
jgi:TetR/AcrR family transcriptional regulator, cholesterol catabolism regulator